MFDNCLIEPIKKIEENKQNKLATPPTKTVEFKSVEACDVTNYQEILDIQESEMQESLKPELELEPEDEDEEEEGELVTKATTEEIIEKKSGDV